MRFGLCNLKGSYLRLLHIKTFKKTTKTASRPKKLGEVSHRSLYLTGGDPVSHHPVTVSFRSGKFVYENESCSRKDRQGNE